MAKILIVDDEVGIRELLSEILRDEGHDIILAENAAAARAARNAARQSKDFARADATYRAYNSNIAHPAWAGLTCSSCHTASSATAPTPAGTMVAVPANISFPTAPATSYWCRRP